MHKKLLRCSILFVVGFMFYITVEVLFRGYSYALMGVCGGLTLIIVDTFNDKISWDMDILLQGLFGSFVITIFELVIGEAAKAWDIIPVMWDYSEQLWNFDGVICPLFSLIWIAFAILAVFVADAINYYVFNEQPTPYYKLLGKTILEFKNK